MLVTKEEIKMNFRGYDIAIPKGTATTHQTATGKDENYNFINDFSWIPKYKDGTPMHGLIHDAIHYGINIPANKLKRR